MPRGVRETSQGRHNTSSHGQTVDKWQIQGFSLVFRLSVVPLLPDPAAFSTQPLSLKQGIIYSAHIDKLILPHSHHSQQETNATQQQKKSPPGALKMLQKCHCPCASLYAEQERKRGNLPKEMQQAEPEIQDYWNYSHMFTQGVLFWSVLVFLCTIKVLPFPSQLKKKKKIKEKVSSGAGIESLQGGSRCSGHALLGWSIWSIPPCSQTCPVNSCGIITSSRHKIKCNP